LIIYFVVAAIRKFVNLLSAINLITFSGHFLKKNVKSVCFIGKTVKLYCIPDAVGVAFRIYVFVAPETSPKILEKPRKNVIFLTLTSP